MTFLRILKEKENKIKSIPEALNLYNFLDPVKKNIHSDLFHGFDTKNNTLSLFEVNSPNEIERVIAHIEVLRTQLERLPKKVFYVELSSNELTSLNCLIKHTPIKNNVYDTFVQNSHYDIIDLDSIKLSNLIYQINNNILNNTLTRKNFTKEQVFNAIRDNYNAGNLMLENYTEVDKIKNFFDKVSSQ